MNHEFTKEESNHWEKLVTALPFDGLKEVLKKMEGLFGSDGISPQISEEELRDYIISLWPEDYSFTRPVYAKIKAVAKKYGCYTEKDLALPLNDNVRSETIVAAIVQKVQDNAAKASAQNLDLGVVTNPKNWKRNHKYKYNGLWDRHYSCAGGQQRLDAECLDDGEKITELKIYLASN
jgi:hypothetical protein